jgi:hypothetical protein
MKIPALLFIALTSHALAEGKDTLAPKDLKPEDSSMDREFGTFLKWRPYSTTFGLSVWQTEGSTLMERSFPGGHQIEEEKFVKPETKSGNEYLKKATDALDKKVKDWEEENLVKLGSDGQYGLADKPEKEIREIMAARSLLWVDKYEKLGLNRQLRFKDDDGSAVLLRVRDKFQMLNEDSGAASFVYSNDREADKEGYSFNGAVMLDIYNQRLYNEPWITNPSWIQNPYRFWLRLGVEQQYNSIDADNPRDVFTTYALLNFQANPDQSATFFGIPGLEITSPQIIQLGVGYENNRITGDESLKWIIGWEPRFLITEPHWGDFARGFGLNNRMYFKKGSFAELATQPEKGAVAKTPVDPAAETDRILKQRSKIFSFINPGVSVEGASDARVNLPKLPTAINYASLKALTDEVITYQLALGLGFDFTNSVQDATEATLSLSYTLKGVQPLDGFDDGHIWHEVRAEMNLTQAYNAFDGSKGGPNDWAGLTAYISWQKGEAPPSYEDTDLIMAGVSTRF